MTNSRRDFLKKTTIISAGTILGNTLFANNDSKKMVFVNPDHSIIKKRKPDTPYNLADLPYGYDALEPYIDKQTMEIHYGKHHRGYVTNLNLAIEKLDAELKGKALTFDAIFTNINKLPEAVRNNGGGHYNHQLFWGLMKPNVAPNVPIGKLNDALILKFGSLEIFKQQFADASLKRFGSGWCWLVINKSGDLEIGSTPNQDNPLMCLKGKGLKGKPVLALDVWEHAYYLKNQNRRLDYINNWWNVVNWEAAEQLFTDATSAKK